MIGSGSAPEPIKLKLINGIPQVFYRSAPLSTGEFTVPAGQSVVLSTWRLDGPSTETYDLYRDGTFVEKVSITGYEKIFTTAGNYQLRPSPNTETLNGNFGAAATVLLQSGQPVHINLVQPESTSPDDTPASGVFYVDVGQGQTLYVNTTFAGGFNVRDPSGARIDYRPNPGDLTIANLAAGRYQIVFYGTGEGELTADLVTRQL